MSDTVRYNQFMSSRVPIDRLVWDDWNRDHIAKHEVTPREAEEVVAGDAMFQASYKQRFVVTGPTLAARMLTVIIGPVPRETGSFYVFSARPASRQERRAYQQQHEGQIP
ncbi:MAG TPA: BrnT family toxin [Thermomicrobiaceae bacterium]|nr:BrnT family toxin [Thermomicrobiaceae bacterium]